VAWQNRRNLSRAHRRPRTKSLCRRRLQLV